MIDQHLGARIVEARDQLGLSQSDIAGEIGISVSRLVEFESGGTRIPAVFIARLCRALSVTPKWFHNGLPGQDEFDRAV
ncbi:MAG: helix-turn-helix transcriptional regulator [Pseudomonadota bacterium]